MAKALVGPLVDYLLHALVGLGSEWELGVEHLPPIHLLCCIQFWVKEIPKTGNTQYDVKDSSGVSCPVAVPGAYYWSCSLSTRHVI